MGRVDLGGRPRMKNNDTSIELVGEEAAARDMARWAKELAPALKDKAGPFAESVRGRVQGKVPVLTGTLAASVTVVEDETGVGVAIGGDDAPYAGWIEFGGSRGRALIPEGRYLYPTAADADAEYMQLAENVAEDTARRFPWSTPST